ncbi:hypothetical protein PanWU01x14_303730 [Parasponia andersonii]|uniref:Uncharacterized protein n=1 Tax=Parasponia andersonii TaxID=3476 RepID=A0A2P5ASS5_PARAD|nr:hypothetical protein PanWU01x14_303730 [Parasponia andersonii]
MKVHKEDKPCVFLGWRRRRRRVDRVAGTEANGYKRLKHEQKVQIPKVKKELRRCPVTGEGEIPSPQSSFYRRVISRMDSIALNRQDQIIPAHIVKGPNVNNNLVFRFGLVSTE